MNAIETGAFEVADEILDVTNRLFERLSDAQPWIVRIGHGYDLYIRAVEGGDITIKAVE